jgi:N-acetylglucosaminyldiphosphoundecaprenol N-acetyl-beta-D-mannosaminyltransferase
VAERDNVLGVAVSAIDMVGALAAIEGWIGGDRHDYVCVTGVHGVIESRRSPRLRAIHNAAGLVVPDGMPLVWLLRRAGYREADRVYGPDLMLAALARPALRDCRHFLYGSSPASIARLRRNLEARFPALRIAGAISPPFRPLSRAEDEAVVTAIDRSGAEIVWVGLSTPKQEIWMAEHRARLRANVLIGVGAAFDMHAGLLRQAPRAMQRCGLEWLFRLAVEPRRLWRRYLRNNPRFIAEVLAQATGLRRYRLDGDQDQ